MVDPPKIHPEVALKQFHKVQIHHIFPTNVGVHSIACTFQGTFGV